MRVLVTGGTGFIGSAVVSMLLQRGDTVTVLDHHKPVEHGKRARGKASYVKGEACEASSYAQFGKERFDCIIHLASITDTTFPDDEEMVRQNVGGFNHLLSYAKSCRPMPRLVYASSAGVYGNGPVPMREQQKPEPLNAYAKSKAAMDAMARDAMAKKDFIDMLIVGLRFFNVFGPGEARKGTSASMIFQLTRQLLHGKRPRLFFDGSQQRDHIYVKDAARAALLATNANASGIYNVGTGISTSFIELLGMIQEVLGTKARVEFFENPYEKAYQNHTMAATDAAEKGLGFTAQYKLRDAIREYVTMIQEGTA